MSTDAYQKAAFEKAARKAFRFLIDERGFEEPPLEMARGYVLHYRQPESEVAILVAIDGDIYPGQCYPACVNLAVALPGEEFPRDFNIERILADLNISVHEFSHSGGDVGASYTRYFEEIADALSENWDAVIDKAKAAGEESRL